MKNTNENVTMNNMIGAMTISAKTTKKGLQMYLQTAMNEKVLDNSLVIGGVVKDLLERMKVDANAVTKEELFKWATNIQEVLQENKTPETPAETVVEVIVEKKVAPVETQLKPKKGLKKKETPPVVDVVDVPAPVEEEKAVVVIEPVEEKKVVKKSTKKVKKAENDPANMACATIFPEVIDHEILGHLVRKNNDFYSMLEVTTAIEEGRALIFACYWKKKDIKQFNYGTMYDVPAPTEFANDLDLVQAIITCDNIKRLYGMSTYTEAMFKFDEEDLMPIVDQDIHTGEDYKIRVCSGLEYEIYEVVEVAETK